jgi:hypothetical protein
MNQTTGVLPLIASAVAAAVCCAAPHAASGQTAPGPNAVYIAKTAFGGCGPGVVTMKAGAGVLPSPGIPAAVTAPVQVRQFVHLQSETPKTGAPYSAVGTTEMVQTLADGNRIVHTNTSRYYRDSSGRMRTEMSLSAVGPFALDESNSVVMINDPVAKQRFVLHPDQKRGEVLPLTAIAFAAGASNDKQGVNSGVATTSNTVDASPSAALPPLPPIHCTPGATSTPSTTVSLGQKTLAGLTANGTRVEYTIPAGQIGNEQPITVTSEQWASDELGVILSSTEHDPMMGDTQFHLAQIERAEPDPSLFVVPADYTLINVTADRKVIIQR